MHTPGLRLAMPATVHDAYHLLRQALRQPDPVVFIEHKALYAMAEEVDLAVPAPDWGRAAVRREGRDLVIVTYSRQVHFALQAAETLAAEGIEADGDRPPHAQPARLRHRPRGGGAHGPRDGRLRGADDGGRRRRARRADFGGVLRLPREPRRPGRGRGHSDLRLGRTRAQLGARRPTSSPRRRGGSSDDGQRPPHAAPRRDDGGRRPRRLARGAGQAVQARRSARGDRDGQDGGRVPGAVGRCAAGALGADRRPGEGRHAHRAAGRAGRSGGPVVGTGGTCARRPSTGRRDAGAPRPQGGSRSRATARDPARAPDRPAEWDRPCLAPGNGSARADRTAGRGGCVGARTRHRAARWHRPPRRRTCHRPVRALPARLRRRPHGLGRIVRAHGEGRLPHGRGRSSRSRRHDPRSGNGCRPRRAAPCHRHGCRAARTAPPRRPLHGRDPGCRPRRDDPHRLARRSSPPPASATPSTLASSAASPAPARRGKWPTSSTA